MNLGTIKAVIGHATRQDSRFVPTSKRQIPMYDVYSVIVAGRETYHIVPERTAMPVMAKVYELGISRSDAQLLTDQCKQYSIQVN